MTQPHPLTDRNAEQLRRHKKHILGAGEAGVTSSRTHCFCCHSLGFMFFPGLLARSGVHLTEEHYRYLKECPESLPLRWLRK